jgi:hypothetical protein
MVDTGISFQELMVWVEIDGSVRCAWAFGRSMG